MQMYNYVMRFFHNAGFGQRVRQAPAAPAEVRAAGRAPRVEDRKRPRKLMLPGTPDYQKPPVQPSSKKWLRHFFDTLTSTEAARPMGLARADPRR